MKEMLIHIMSGITGSGIMLGINDFFCYVLELHQSEAMMGTLVLVGLLGGIIYGYSLRKRILSS